MRGRCGNTWISFQMPPLSGCQWEMKDNYIFLDPPALKIIYIYISGGDCLVWEGEHSKISYWNFVFIKSFITRASAPNTPGVRYNPATERSLYKTLQHARENPKVLMNKNHPMKKVILRPFKTFNEFSG